MKKAIILTSGGVDSSVTLAIASLSGYSLYAVSFSYGQRHNIEIEKIKQLLKNYDVKQHKIFNIDLSSFTSSSLINKDLSVPKYSDPSELRGDIPTTYVPARNTIFLSYAFGYAEVIGAYDIFIGVHSEDSANYPDCRIEYIKKFENMLNLATSKEKRFKIHAPLIEMNKIDIVAKGLEIGVDFSKTISCYDPANDGASCGNCHACLIRIKAFENNNTIDPISYIKK